MRIHATMVRLKRRLQTVQAALISLENFDRYSPRDTEKFTMTYYPIDFNTDMAKVPY